MEKKKFLFVSLDGLIADIAWQVVKEGHEVKLFIDSKDEREIADGFVSKTDDWARDVPWADVIVFDDTLGQGLRFVATSLAGLAVSFWAMSFSVVQNTTIGVCPPWLG